VITHRLPLSQIGEALAAIHRREAVKVILEP
jgi:threonine dehydrogenase-like Zn-dependent dehydrogenase